MEDTLFLYVASGADWWNRATGEEVYRSLLEAGAPVWKLDERDPPRRQCGGQAEFANFWATRRRESVRWLFLRFGGAKTADKRWRKAFLVFSMRDTHSPEQANAWSYAYGLIPASELDSTMRIWRSLCRSLCPFHAFVDLKRRYEFRAHKVLPSGEVEKTWGWYLRFLPGLFRANFFGRPYLKIFGEKLASLEVVEFASDCSAFILTGDLLDQQLTLSDNEWRILRQLGPKYFHLPELPDEGKTAPAVSELLQHRAAV